MKAINNKPTPLCEEQGCTKEGIECRLFVPEISLLQKFLNFFRNKNKRNYMTLQTSFYCSDHCEQNGFCYLCGEFWSGVESFDFADSRGGVKRICENCTDSLGSEMNEDDEDADYCCGGFRKDCCDSAI